MQDLGAVVGDLAGLAMVQLRDQARVGNHARVGGEMPGTSFHSTTRFAPSARARSVAGVGAAPAHGRDAGSGAADEARHYDDGAGTSRGRRLRARRVVSAWFGAAEPWCSSVATTSSESTYWARRPARASAAVRSAPTSARRARRSDRWRVAPGDPAGRRPCRGRYSRAAASTAARSFRRRPCRHQARTTHDAGAGTSRLPCSPRCGARPGHGRTSSRRSVIPRARTAR